MTPVGPMSLRELLRQRNMQQSDLAEVLHLPKQTLNNYITGRRKVPLKLAIQIARLLGRAVEEISFADDVSKMGSNIS